MIDIQCTVSGWRLLLSSAVFSRFGSSWVLYMCCAKRILRRHHINASDWQILHILLFFCSNHVKYECAGNYTCYNLQYTKIQNCISNKCNYVSFDVSNIYYDVIMHSAAQPVHLKLQCLPRNRDLFVSSPVVQPTLSLIPFRILLV